MVKASKESVTRGQTVIVQLSVSPVRLRETRILKQNGLYKTPAASRSLILPQFRSFFGIRIEAMRSPTRFLLSSQPVQAADRMDAALAFHSDVILTLAVLLCAFICVLGLGFVARCAWLRRSLNASDFSYDRPLPLPLLRIPRKGIKKKTLRALPTVSFVSSSDAAAAPGGVELVDCAICLAEFADGDRVRVLPQCGHGFHAACVDTWLGSNASCPSCRRVLVVPAPPRRCQKCGGDGDSAGAAASAKPTESGGASTSKTAHQICVR